MDETHVSPTSERKEKPEVQTPLKKDECTVQYGGVTTDENVHLIDSDSKDENKCTKLCGILANLTIEPAIFGFMFAFIMNLSIMTNMMMDKGCLYHLNYSSEICQNLSNHPDEKKNVEILATTYSLYSNLTNFIAALLMTFIAPWSDKYGRKLPLLMSITGAVLTDVGIILCTVYFESRLEYLIVARLPAEFAGGFICMLALSFSHASETSTEKNRTLKYTSVEIALGLGIAFGGLSGGLFYKYYGYTYVYLTVAVFHIFCFVWTLFMVEETRGLDVSAKWHQKAKEFFSCESFKSSFKTTFKKRDGNTRAIILCILVSMCVIVLNFEAYGSIAFVYVHHVYNWDPSIFNVVNTTSSLFGLLVTLVVVPILVRVFKIQDYSLGIIGVLSYMAKNIFIAFSKYHTFLYYIGLSLGGMNTLSSLAIRSGLSKLVQRDELGQVFAFLATCEAVMPMLGTVVVTEIFNSTIDIFPNVTYSVSVVILVIPLGTFIWALKSTKNTYNTTLSVSTIDPGREKA